MTLTTFLAIIGGITLLYAFALVILEYGAHIYLGAKTFNERVKEIAIRKEHKKKLKLEKKKEKPE